MGEFNDSLSQPGSNDDDDKPYRGFIRQLPYIEFPRDLLEMVSGGLHALLRRAPDRELLDELSMMVGEIIGDIPMDAVEHEVRAATRLAADRCLDILQTARNLRKPRQSIMAWGGPRPTPAPAPPASEPVPDDDTKPDKDLVYHLPSHLTHLLTHMDYVIPRPPLFQDYGAFEHLAEAAISHRVSRVLAFFQRHNPNIKRELPPPFLASPEFAAKFQRAIERLIYPAIRNSRPLRILSTSCNWSTMDPESFWELASSQYKTKLVEAWSIAWDDLKLIESGKEGMSVWQIKESTKALRDFLQPDTEEGYDLPRLGNREIDIIISLLDPENDWWEKLSEIWQSSQYLYEQEMDPRVFQQQAREGALRDHLLSAMHVLPEQWGDFLVLVCHRVFPRLGTSFLERFVSNLGRDEVERERRSPYLIRYLKQARERPAIKVREREDEEAWRAQNEDLRNYLKGRAAESPTGG